MSNSKKNIASILLISILLLSGCIEDTDTETIGNSDNISSGIDHDNISVDSMTIVDDLPFGYIYLGSLTITDYTEFSENIIGSKEGAYRDKDNFDVFLDIIELDSEQSAFEFISNYKANYKPLAIGNRFTSLSFNGHDATRITEYRNSGGTQLPKYQIIWNKNNVVIIIRSNSNLESSAMNLAVATGY